MWKAILLNQDFTLFEKVFKTEELEGIYAKLIL
jgi:hypothetical protein